MSINITQDMCFETDDLESFEAMLLVAVRTMFRRPRGHTKTLYLNLTAPSYWPDGKSHRDEWMSQPPYLRATKDGDDCRVLEIDRVYHGATQMRFASQPCSAEEAAKLCCDQREKSIPTRRWATTLRPSAYNESDLKDKLRCRGPEDAVSKVLVFLRQEDNVGLRGIRNVHAGGDGSYGLAYRMEGTGRSIYISVTYAYYGK